MAAADEPFLDAVGLRPMSVSVALDLAARVADAAEPCWAIADIDWPRFRPLFDASHRRPLLDLIPDHRVKAAHEPPQTGAPVEFQRHAIDRAPLKSGEVERGLPKRLRWQGARVDARAPHGRRLLDECHPFAEVCRLCRALFAGGT